MGMGSSHVSDATKTLVDGLVNSGKNVVFSKSYCPYCTATKNLLNSKGVAYELLELDQRRDGSEIQQYLAELTSQTTVPNTFLKGKHIGGNSDLQQLNQSGELNRILA